MKEIKVIKECTNIKKPKILPSNKIEIFAARKLRFKAAEYQKNNTGVVIVLPENVPDREFTNSTLAKTDYSLNF